MRDAGLSVGAAKPSCQPRTSAPTSGERSAVTASVGCRHKVANDPTAAVVACYNLDGPRCACHRYHLKAAEKDPETHCPHASKAGGGMCANKAGKRFDTFCKEYVHGTLPPTRTLVFNEMLAGSVHLVAKLPLPGGLPLVRSQKKNRAKRANACSTRSLCFMFQTPSPNTFFILKHSSQPPCSVPAVRLCPLGTPPSYATTCAGAKGDYPYRAYLDCVAAVSAMPLGTQLPPDEAGDTFSCREYVDAP